ncbi:MAG: UDP-N-acetylmuramoylalanine--D-glutamate ligase [Candidatus Terrybacteria bacterium RIFCSPHIGHO2_01_FULL_48_17]|uniref:UDP-N-acetylmuramoylalanine--D-glutamate ligase n=1 Tax=Candidatus Terrybacteria bacterium RIFCSPHIGHO2_01_FULL_48_17 TaxID=1802362 RepID=A0A1G2PIK1_9BACT|nr:MAG: UDP-N-acetylmuramoylalanine--D-glutamate ligase [Candidatus Terrybacteria bacterium RIFCSPHIGHO2_01_FULL_48_17]OHA53865.1 MAG: UDP-N-acetylmuramoylalanine--D-glutamate ligase [Candidatus Terrybacteria bacterium RIFCSPLOWO2_01_FULL_48_14]
MKREDFKGKKVLVMGLGTHGGGAGTARFLSDSGAKVTVTDLKSEKDLGEPLNELRGLSIHYVLNGHHEDDFKNTDLIIRNPGVPVHSPYLAIAQKQSVPIETDGSLFLKLCPSFTIGITGTKGKSTTTALTTAMLRKGGVDAKACGLPGTSLLEALEDLKGKSVAVAELSSWQLEGITHEGKGPRVAVITNVFADHLKDYPSFEAYREAKSRILLYQNRKDVAVLNLDDPNTPVLLKKIRGECSFFSGISCEKMTGQKGICISHDNIFFEDGGQEHMFSFIQSELSLRGPHNISNIAAALCAIFSATRHSQWENVPFDPSAYQRAIKVFPGLEGRLEFIGMKEGVTYINDTAATNPGAVEAALKSIPQDTKIILICGGQDKGLEYHKLAERIMQRVKYVIFLGGTATEKLYAALQKLNFIRTSQVFSDMQSAVQAAKQLAERGDIILLSPGAASFNLFADEFARGRAFKNAVGL